MEPLPKELLDLEHQLRLHTPQPPLASREQMLFQAGREAALAQQASAFPTAQTALPMKLPYSTTNTYWAAACAALFLLSTALGWQVWQQPQPSAPIIITIAPATPQESIPGTPSSAANTENTFADVELRVAELPTSGLVNYLELRERVTRGGLSMWPVSTPAPADPGNTTQVPTRDWQEELFRETL